VTKPNVALERKPNGKNNGASKCYVLTSSFLQNQHSRAREEAERLAREEAERRAREAERRAREEAER
jgi:hypothetical protein